MSNKKSDFVRAVIPMLVCRDAAAEIDFCMTAFGAVELSRRAIAVSPVMRQLVFGNSLP